MPMVLLLLGCGGSDSGSPNGTQPDAPTVDTSLSPDAPDLDPLTEPDAPSADDAIEAANNRLEEVCAAFLDGVSNLYSSPAVPIDVDESLLGPGPFCLTGDVNSLDTFAGLSVYPQDETACEQLGAGHSPSDLGGSVDQAVMVSGTPIVIQYRSPSELASDGASSDAFGIVWVRWCDGDFYFESQLNLNGAGGRDPVDAMTSLAASVIDA